MIITTGFTDLSAEAHRNQTAALLATTTSLDPNGTPANLTVYGGVHSGFFLSGGSTLTGTVGAGRAIIPSASAEGGAYVVTMTEPENVTFEPGDGTYTRYDLVYLQIDEVPAPAEPPVEGEPEPEPAYVPGATLKIVKGTGVTGTTTPPIPATPANSIPLWAVKIKPTTTVATGYLAGNAVDRRARLKLANQDRQPFSMAAGQTTVTVTKNMIYGAKAISFPAGRFRVPPIVTIALSSAPGGSNSLVPRTINNSPNGVSIYLYTADEKPASTTANVTVEVQWTAVQMSEDAADG